MAVMLGRFQEMLVYLNPWAYSRLHSRDIRTGRSAQRRCTTNSLTRGQARSVERRLRVLEEQARAGRLHNPDRLLGSHPAGSESHAAERTVDLFIEQLSKASDRYEARRRMTEDIERHEPIVARLREVLDQQQANVVFLAAMSGDLPELKLVREHISKGMQGAETDLQAELQILESAREKLLRANPELLAVMKELYRHSDAFLAESRNGEMRGITVSEDFISSLRHARTCCIRLSRIENDCKHPIFRSIRGRSDIILDTAHKPSVGQLDATDRTEGTEDSCTAAMNRIKVQVMALRGDQVELESQFLRMHGIPFITEYERRSWEEHGHVSPLTELSSEPDSTPILPDHDATEGIEAVRDGWGSEPAARRDFRHQRYRVFDHQEWRRTAKLNHLIAFFEGLTLPQDVSQVGRLYREHLATPEGLQYQELMQRLSQQLQHMEAVYTDARHDTFYNTLHGYEFRPFADPELASRREDRTGGSVSHRLRRDLPLTLRRYGLGRRVERWRRSLPSEVRRATVSTASRSASASIFSETSSTESWRLAQIRKMQIRSRELRRDLRHRGVPIAE